MPVPTNLTPGTAIDITVLPYDFTIVAADIALAPSGSGFGTCDANERHELWWKRTAGLGEIFFTFGVKNASNIVNYRPKVSIWTGPNIGSLTQIVITNPATFGTEANYCDDFSLAGQPGTTAWFRLPTTSGQTYYFQVVALNAGAVDADLNIVAQLPPPVTFAPGDIIITDDSYTFPAVVYDSTGIMKGYLPLPAGGEVQAALSSRLFIFNSLYPRGIGLWGRGEIYDTLDMSLVSGYFPVNGNGVSPDQSSTYFYNYSDNGVNTYIEKIDQNGVVVQTFIIPIATFDLSGGFNAINRDGTIVYVVDINDTQTKVKRWDLINGVALSDFFIVTDPVNQQIALLLVSFNDNIVIGVRDFNTGFNPYYVYNATGALVNSTPDIGYVMHRYAISLLDNSFWTWDVGNTYRHHSIPNLTVTETFNSLIFGASYRSNTLNTLSPFGQSDTCPLIIIPSLATPPPITIPNSGSGIYKIVPDKHNDTLWNDTLTDSFDVKIPNPFGKTGLLGE